MVRYDWNSARSDIQRSHRKWSIRWQRWRVRFRLYSVDRSQWICTMVDGRPIDRSFGTHAYRCRLSSDRAGMNTWPVRRQRGYLHRPTDSPLDLVRRMWSLCRRVFRGPMCHPPGTGVAMVHLVCSLHRIRTALRLHSRWHWWPVSFCHFSLALVFGSQHLEYRTSWVLWHTRFMHKILTNTLWHLAAPWAGLLACDQWLA